MGEVGGEGQGGILLNGKQGSVKLEDGAGGGTGGGGGCEGAGE